MSSDEADMWASAENKWNGNENAWVDPNIRRSYKGAAAVDVDDIWAAVEDPPLIFEHSSFQDPHAAHESADRSDFLPPVSSSRWKADSDSGGHPRARANEDGSRQSSSTHAPEREHAARITNANDR